VDTVSKANKMQDDPNKEPAWVTRGKSIRQLIEELQTFEDQELEVKISTDDGSTFKCISLVVKKHKEGSYFCGLENCEQTLPSPTHSS
jgi:hypothetical protein